MPQLRPPSLLVYKSVQSFNSANLNSQHNVAKSRMGERVSPSLSSFQLKVIMNILIA
jgi:hypothetical protein